jgi:hypothetical protein
MPEYMWAGPLARPNVTSTEPLGYPWREVPAPADNPEVELAVATADAILAEVGDDAAKAQAALTAENAREKPRTALTRKLERIIANA